MTFSLDASCHETTGQLLSLRDPALDLTFARFAPGAELELNGCPLETRLVSVNEGVGEHIAVLEGKLRSAYGAGVTLSIRRLLTRGAVRCHSGPPNSLHIRYEITRVPGTTPGAGLDYIWQPPIEAPLRLDSFTALAAPTAWFGPDTRMRALAIGGSGPREHVSYEDGPVAEVVPYLRAAFRNTFPGQQTINGALYYHPDDQRWLWIIVRRPTTGGYIDFTPQRQACVFHYFKDMNLQDEVFTPAISLFWGRGLDQAERVLAEQFDLYEEPPAWWYKSTWFWLHPGWAHGMDFRAAETGAHVLMDECGVNGFGVLMHDIPWAGNDIDVGSGRPMPTHGGYAAMERLAKGIRDKGGHTYVWFTRMGHRPDSLSAGASWSIRGIDGRPVRIRSVPDAKVNIDIVNPGDPTYRDYLMHWVEFYVKRLGITGLFWDSGMQPLPPDFGAKPYQRWPGETGPRGLELYDTIYRFGRSLSDDFFMWVEGISTDVTMNAFAVDNKMHGPRSAHPLMHRIAHAGSKRLVWRSAWAHDLASGFPFIQPVNDVGWKTPRYKEIAADPDNRWVCRLVQERGVRSAVGLADGISLLDEYVVVCPKCVGGVVVPGHLARGETLKHVRTGKQTAGRRTDAGVAFDLTDSGGYLMQ